MPLYESSLLKEKPVVDLTGTDPPTLVTTTKQAVEKAVVKVNASELSDVLLKVPNLNCSPEG